MALNYVTLTLDLYDTQGNPLDAGLVSFYPSAALVDTTEHQDIPQVSVVVDLSEQAELPRTVSLLATDNANTSPSGWGWTVSFSGVPGDPASFSFFLAHADGASQYLSAQTPVEDVTTMGAYMPLPSGTATSGYVPVATGSGEASAWAAVGGGDVSQLAPSGDTTGATDTAAIQALLTAGAAALQEGIFYIDAPLSFPPGAVLLGQPSADPVAWSDATAGTVIKAASGFSGTSMLAFPDVSHAVTQGPTVTNVALDGTLLPGTTDGIRGTGPVNQARLRYMVIAGVTGVGINCVTDASASGQTYPYGWDVQYVRIYSAGQQGVVIANHSDGTWVDVHVLGNSAHSSGHGWSLAGPCYNSRFIGCRAEWAGAGKDGFHLTGAWGTGTGSGGTTFVGCSTDRNDNNGVFCNVTGTVPVTFTGCMFRRDGRNSGSAGGGFAGIWVSSATIPLSFANCTVFPGVDDGGAGTNSPEYGASVTGSSNVTLQGGYIQGAVAGIHNGGTNTNFYIGPEVVSASGTTASPVLASPVVLPLTLGGTDNTTGQPSGAAGGDLSGTYPNPTVAGIDGTELSGGQPAGNPITGSVLTSIAGNSMSWQPPQNPTRAFRPQKIKIDQAVWMGTSGHPFTFAGVGTTGNNNDTSTYVLGSESVYVTSNGSGAQAKISGTFGSALNLTGQSLVLWIQLDTYANQLSGYPRVYVGDTGLSNCYEWKIGEAAGQPWALDGEWMRITLPFGSAATVGSPNRASLAALTIQVFDNSGGPVTLHFGGIATMLEPAQLFPKGVISITFDDGLISQYNTAAPLMDAYGWGGTANLITETLWNHAGGAFNDYFALTNAQQLEKYHGWEMATHAYTAANHNSTYTGISDAAALADMQAAKNYMQLQGFRSPDLMAFPLGLYNANTLTNVSTMFTAGRSISQLGSFADETVPPADLLRLRSQTFGDANTLTQAENLALAASNNHEWVIYTFHDIVTSAVTNLEWSTANFTSLLSYINGLGTPVMLVSDVLRAGAQADIQVVSAIAAGDTSVVIGGTATAPTIETATLDVIAADHPPAGAVAMNGQKITGLANGVASTDAATVAQITGGGGGTVTSVTAGDTSIVVGGTGAAPTIETGTLDVIATDHAPAGNWSNNSHKITSLANGSASSDAAAFGQIPVVDSTSSDLQPIGTATAGSTGKWADAGHIHPNTAPGAPLALKYYAPGSVSDKSVTATTLTPFDTTNLTISFTAPPSGNVMIDVQALIIPTTAVEWNVALTLHGTPGTVLGAIYNCKDGSTNTQTPRRFKFYITGLTPGNSYQYDFSGCSASAALQVGCYGDTSTTPTADNIGGPFIMEVFAR